MKYFFIVFLFLSLPVKSQVVVFDPAAEVTRLLELAETVIQTKQQIEMLGSINGATELLNYLNLEEFAKLREHAPEKFMDVLKAVSDIEGGIQAIDDLLVALDGWDVDSEWSRDNALRALYKYQLEHVKKSKAYAAADYESATQSISDIDSSTKTSMQYETQRARDQAQVQGTAEVAKSNYRIVQSLSQLLDLIAAEQAEDLNAQKRFIQATEDRTAFEYTSK